MTISFYSSMETFSAVLTKIQVGQNPSPFPFVSFLGPSRATYILGRLLDALEI
jgi:hypothetical protein